MVALVSAYYLPQTLEMESLEFVSEFGSGFGLEFGVSVRGQSFRARVWSLGQGLGQSLRPESGVWVRVWSLGQSFGPESGEFGARVRGLGESRSEFWVKVWSFGQFLGPKSAVSKESESRLPQAHGLGSKAEFGARVWSLVRVEGQSVI